MTEKLLTFTEKERQMIIYSVLYPKNATDVEIDVFIDVCEKYGFDPLQGDIIFNRYEGKAGATVSYIVVKDAWLKHAKRQSDFVSVQAKAVYENDTFKMNFVEGTVEHSITANRGQITGAWARLITNDGEYVEFVNFEEFYNAFSGKANGKGANIWDRVPSKMIEKTAYIHLIKNHYPLGIMFRGEEEIEQQFYNEPTVDANADKSVSSEAIQAINEQLKQLKEEPTTTPAAEPQNQPVTIEGDKQEEVTDKPVGVNPQEVVTTVTENPIETKPTEEAQQEVTTLFENKEQATESIETTIKNEDSEPVDPNLFVFLKKVVRASNGTATPTTVVTAENLDGQVTLCATGEMFNAFDGFIEGDKFKAEIEVLHMTVKFVRSLERVQ